MQLSTEYQLPKVGADLDEDPGENPSDTSSSKKGSHQWALCGSPPANVQVEEKWQSSQADGDNPTKAMFAKSRIAASLEALAEAPPKFAEKDLTVAHRTSGKRVWQCEVWATRDSDAVYEVWALPRITSQTLTSWPTPRLW